MSLSGLIILMAACVGNAEWWVILVNRLHSQPYESRRLDQIRRIHDLGILCFPLLLLAFCGSGHSTLLEGGSLQDQPAAIQIVLWIALSGLIPLTVGCIRWNLPRHSNRLTNFTAEHFDCLRETGSSRQEQQLVIGNAGALLRRLPGNQIYQLEVSRKRLRFAKRTLMSTPLTTAASNLRLAHFSDTHFHGVPGRGYYDFVFDKLCHTEPDLFVFTGDLLDCMSFLPLATELFSRLTTVAPCYFVLGNHDWCLDHALIREQLMAVGWICAAEKNVSVAHPKGSILIAGTEAPWIGRNPEAPDVSDDHFRLLLSHSPDQRSFAETNQFDLMLCGHNHGGQVVPPVIGPVYSPSRYGVRYAGGVFEHRGLSIHVSRGIGAKDPLRWNCRPEVSLLELDFEA